MNYTLFISFFCGIKGNCPAEWSEDKLRVLESSGRHTIVLTGLGSHVKSTKFIKYLSVPSLSWNDLNEEIKEMKLGGEKLPFYVYFFIPFSFLFGSVFDLFLRMVTKGVSAGRWSWVLTAFPIAIVLIVRYKVHDIFTTGGPISAHIIGALIVRLGKKRLFCEFQDPLIGNMMDQSALTRRISIFIEKWLVASSTRVIYVTKVAARKSCERNPQLANKILAVYPGAWKFLPQVVNQKSLSNYNFEFLHLGTLYGTRNLDLFYKALDQLRESGFDLANKVKVINLGAVYCENASQYLSRDDFELVHAMHRKEALVRASFSTCLLLVQHTDSRSTETIPYKTYDYMNLGLPIFGLLRNTELTEMILKHGGSAAQADNLVSIIENLKICLNNLNSRISNSSPPEMSSSLDISTQFLNIFETDYEGG